MNNNKGIGVEAVNTMEGITMNKEQEKYEIVATGSGEVTEKKADTLESEAVTMQKDTKDNDNMENVSLEGQEMGEMNDTFEEVYGKVTTDAQKKVKYMNKLEAEQELPPVTGEEKKIALLKCEKDGNEYILYAIMIVDKTTKIVDSIDTVLYECTKKEALIGDKSVSFKRENLLKENASYKDLNSLKKYNVDISEKQLSFAFELLMMYIDKGKSISSGDNYSILEVYKEIMKQKDFIVKNYEGCEKSSYHGKKVLKITSEAFQRI